MSSKKKNGLSKELNRKKAMKRRCALICALGVLVVVLISVIRWILAYTGVVPYEVTAADTIVFVLTLCVCFVIAPQFMGYLRLKREIQEIESQLAK